MSRVSLTGVRHAPTSRASLGMPLAIVGVVVVACAVGLLAGSGYLSLIALSLGAAAVLLVFALDRVDLTAIVLVGAALLIDWYQLVGLPLRYPLVAPLLSVVAAAIVFLVQSPARPWIPMPRLWLWGILLALAAIPILRGVSISESIVYYVDVFLTPLFMYVLGTQWTCDVPRLRRLLDVFSAIAALVAAHTIVAGVTGVFLLATPRQAAYLISVSDFTLVGSATTRVGSFLGNPDWNGTFLAMMLFPPIGLLIYATSLRARLLYLVEAVLILSGLLFTYSTAAWLAAAIGLVILLLLIGRGRTRIYGAVLAVVALGGLTVAFPSQVRLLTQHALALKSVSLRIGAWLTALRVIRAHPLGGIGLGLNTYLQRAEPFRVPLQTRPLAHPHNAYLEIAALAGVPVLVFFLVILGTGLTRAVSNLRSVPRGNVPLLAGAVTAIAVLCLNSLGINGWTLAPLAAIAWLMLGAVASPGVRPAAPPIPIKPTWALSTPDTAETAPTPSSGGNEGQT